MGQNPVNVWLVGGLEHLDYFSIYWEQESHLTFIFFRGVETTNQLLMDDIPWYSPKSDKFIGQNTHPQVPKPSRAPCAARQASAALLPSVATATSLATTLGVAIRELRDAVEPLGSWNCGGISPKHRSQSIWLVVWNMTFFSYNYWECHHPNWRSVFFRGVGIPPTRYRCTKNTH